MEYLFRKLDYLKNISEGKYLLIFCDFDGTLTPIAKTPEKAVIRKSTKELLRKLSQAPDCKMVIISGRTVKSLETKIHLKNIIYSGNHGLEIKGYGFTFKAIVSQKYKNALKTIKKRLLYKLSDIKGILLEDKKFSLSIHYRLVNKKYIPSVKTIVNDVILSYDKSKDIKVKQGKKVFEIMPPIDWDKGKAVLRILKRQQDLLKNKNVFPVYFGDDNTDEDAFNILRNKGITIFVGKSKFSPTRITMSKSDPCPSGRRADKSEPFNSSLSKARYYVKDTREVVKMLKYILEIRK